VKKLFEGLTRFRKEQYEEDAPLFQRLASGQDPDVLFITCSDSRVVPNLVTQTKPGDLFVIRNAGNMVAPYGAGDLSIAGTVEYAVDALKVKDIVVCGHAQCGAVTAILQPESLNALPEVKRFLEQAATTRRLADKCLGHLEGEAKIRAAIQANVLVQMTNLRTHPSVAAALAEGRLNLHGWVYDFATGKVVTYDPAEGTFVAHEKASTESTAPRNEMQHVAQLDGAEEAEG
jgi:carbonic anhydrase